MGVLEVEEKLLGEDRSFRVVAGVLLGLGHGCIFDGIVLHQLLQWHHMVSQAGYPPDTIANLRFNVFADGLFHLATYGLVVAGILLLWQRARQPHLLWSARLLAGSLLTGFGAFNLIEGTINHQLLGIHHVNEIVPRDQWIWWDLGFLVWGAIMLVLGVILVRSPRAPDAGMRVTGRRGAPECGH